MIKYKEMDEEKVQQSVESLAPWFSLDGQDEKEYIEEGSRINTKFDLNHLQVEKGGGRFRPPSTILLSVELEERELEFVLGHELGHWYHHLINSKTHNIHNEPGWIRNDFYIFNEALANYSGIILKERGLPFSEEKILQKINQKFAEDTISTDKLGCLSVVQLYWPRNLARLEEEDILKNTYYLKPFFKDVLAPSLPKGHRKSLLELLENSLKTYF